jgi:hypothetical protein
MGNWRPLNREQAMAARDFSRAGETFIDHKDLLHEISYSILTPLGYQVFVSKQVLQHVEKHPIAARYQAEIFHLEKMEIRLCGNVAEFIFGPSNRILFGDEGQPGLEVGRNRKKGKIVAFMSYNFPQLYERILTGLKNKPFPGRFSVESVDEVDKVTPICDLRVKNATFAEIVQWVWEKYYAHLEQGLAVKSEM